jgi:hypothetical protein
MQGARLIQTSGMRCLTSSGDAASPLRQMRWRTATKCTGADGLALVLLTHRRSPKKEMAGHTENQRLAHLHTCTFAQSHLQLIHPPRLALASRVG